MRRGDRVAEGGALLRRYTGLNLYRGFESLPLRQIKRTHPGPFYLAREMEGLFEPSGSTKRSLIAWDADAAKCVSGPEALAASGRGFRRGNAKAEQSLPPFT